MIFPGFPGVLSFFQVFQVEWEPCYYIYMFHIFSLQFPDLPKTHTVTDRLRKKLPSVSRKADNITVLNFDYHWCVIWGKFVLFLALCSLMELLLVASQSV